MRLPRGAGCWCEVPVARRAQQPLSQGAANCESLRPARRGQQTQGNHRPQTGAIRNAKKIQKSIRNNNKSTLVKAHKLTRRCPHTRCGTTPPLGRTQPLALHSQTTTTQILYWGSATLPVWGNARVASAARTPSGREQPCVRGGNRMCEERRSWCAGI